MTRRAYIRNGDQTNVKGVVEAPTRNDLLDGREAAYEDDPVWCPQCKTYGRISCVGTRSSSKNASGREMALADDLCLCNCHPYPVLIASQADSFSDA